MVYTLVVHLVAKDDPSSIEKLKLKLREASQIYSNDKETINWFVMQDIAEPRKFTVVERYAQESSQQYHLGNPYWKTFDEYIMPLLAEKMDLRRLEELKTDGERVKVNQDESLWEKIKAHQAA